jgi:transposase
MMYKKYRIQLSEKQCHELITLTRRGKSSVRQLTRARVLLLSDENRPKGVMPEKEISAILGVSLSTIHRIRRQFVKEGLTSALSEKPRSDRPKVFLGSDAAKVTALACSTPPEGHARWSLRLLSDKLVELDLVPTISYHTVSNILKKTNFLRT